MYIISKKVHASFRENVFDMYPILYEREDFVRMFQWLMFGTFTDKEIKQHLIISQDIIAQIENKPLDGKYSAEDFLVDFQQNVLEAFTWSDWIFTEGKSRVVLDKGFSSELERMINEELRNTDRDGLVYFDTGLKPNKQHISNERKMIEMKAIERMAHAKNQDAQNLLEYMNNIPVRKFSTQIMKRIDEAYAESARMDDIHSLALLRHIESQVKPFYGPSTKQNTDRIFGINESILQLKSNVRHILTKDWVELDLRYAHLAIYAKMFNITEVQEFLRGDVSIWDSLLEHYNLPFSSGVKAIFKEALYSICYGMSISNVKKLLDTYFVDTGLDRSSKTFISHPVIKALIDARSNAIKQIKRSGYIITVYGDKLDIKDNNVRSILAQLSQAYELFLLMPVLDLARANQIYFTIMLWQHDGFSVSISYDKEYWIDKIQSVVRKRALVLGIETRLEVKA